MRKQFLEIGKIVATQGLGGEVRVQYYCDSADVICSFDRLFLGKDKQELEVEKARPHKTLAVLKLGGIDNVDEAKTIVGKMLYMDRDDVELPEGVNFIQDLIGLEVKDAGNGRVYGKISDVLRTGANDVYEIKDADGKSYLAPVIDDVVKEINVNDGYVLIVPMKGIFDDEA